MSTSRPLQTITITSSWMTIMITHTDAWEEEDQQADVEEEDQQDEEAGKNDN